MTVPQHPDGMRYGAIIALACSAFVYFTAETLPVGLLPQISASLHVAPATVGLLVTVYAAFAAAGAVPLTSLTLKVPRHLLLILLVVAYVVSQALAAFAPNFGVLIAARVLTALAHGVFWSVMAPVSSRLGPRGQGGKASSLVLIGNTAGMVLGVPLATILGQTVGWRASYGVLAVAGAAATVGLILALPKMPPTPAQASATMRRQLDQARQVILSKPIFVVCCVTTCAVIGQYAVYTYTAPVVARAGGISGTELSLLLLGYGATGLAANVFVGRLVDRHPGAALAGCFGAVVLALVSLSLLHGQVVTWVAVLVWGAGFAAVPLILQQAALRLSPGRRDTASAVRQTAMQIGIAGGSLVGGAILAAGNVAWLAPFGAVVVAVFGVFAVLRPRVFPLTTDPALAPVTTEIEVIATRRT
ncbi:MFS transporter [Frondihabitans australicus]|uniref:Putative MFS family arabinose efflux permease n=1 Tax=Frondihabitans australicus TaxID=386892 RepID=A0A495IIG5_9MICO|nr:MFS transporter [Frondihabitans australicus]RKR75208.1 putative MFS family arabinose efflux permease [Frondihabitans australicus]